MRKLLNPAHGTAQWVGVATNGLPLLRIVSAETDHTYEVDTVPFGYNLTYANGTDIIQYRLRYFAPGMFICNCPDATIRPERRCQCKHARGLVAALKRMI